MSSLSKMETGKTTGVDFETLEKLCDLFQEEPGPFFGLREQAPGQATAV